MITKERRRISSSGRAQQLWDAIKAVRLQKQIPAITRMGRYMSRYYQLKRDDTQRLLDLAVEDNLIKLETKIGTKGTKSGVEEKAYRLPTSDMLSRERHDWYCFKCHAGGEVVLCSTCHRVYHEECVAPEELPGAPGSNASQEEDYVCKYCQAFQKISDESDNKTDRRDLNHLFRLIILRSKKKLPERIYAREVPQPASKNINDPLLVMTPNGTPGSAPGIAGGTGASEGKKLEEELWRASFLLKEQIDFAEIERKCLSIEYRDGSEFKADAHLLVHNIIIFHGVHSAVSELARSAFRDVLRDLRELESCRDCFRHSVEPEGDRHWFTKPCRPAHELVYAKQKGFPFWPAKVIRALDSNLDVRFFGGYHQRALVEKAAVRPISVNIHSLQVKRTSALNKACEELRRHQEVLEKLKDSLDLSGEPIGNPFFEIKVEFPEDDNEDNEDEDEEDPQDTESSSLRGGYPGEADPVGLVEEESDLMKKPCFVPGEGPSPHSPELGTTLSNSSNTLVVNHSINTNVQQQQHQQHQQQHHHHQQQQAAQLTPTVVVSGSSSVGGGGIYTTFSTTSSSSGNSAGGLTTASFMDSSQIISGGPLVNGSPLSIQTLPASPSGQQQPQPQQQQYHILHHLPPGAASSMRLLPGGTLTLDPSHLVDNPTALIAAAPGTNPHPAIIAASSHHHHHLAVAPGNLPGSVPGQQQQPMGTEIAKKKRGRPKKSKKEEAEDFVSSSSNQESRFIHAGVQTPTKLLKTNASTPLVANSSGGQQPPQQPQQTHQTIPLQTQQQHLLVSSSNVLSAAAAAASLTSSSTPNSNDPVQQQQTAPPQLMAANGSAQSLLAAAGPRKPPERDLKEFADKLRQEFEQEKKRAVNVATRSLERDLERLKADHNTEIEELLEKQKMEISENKKKQWCYHCEAEAIYWCCWNTAYCSIECQQEHWHKEHKRMCRRKR